MHTTRKTRKIEHITKTSAHKHNHLRKEVRWGRNHWPIDAHKCRSTHQLYNVSTRGTQEKYDKRHSTIYSRENKLDIAQPMSLTGWLLGCQSALICQSYIFLKSKHLNPTPTTAESVSWTQKPPSTALGDINKFS